MKVQLSNRIYNHVKEDLMKKDFIAALKDFVSTRYNTDRSTLDLTRLSKGQCEWLADFFASCGVYGTKVIAKDIERWLQASDDLNGARARTVMQATAFVEAYVTGLEHHLLFREDEYGGKGHSAYFVSDITYSPEERDAYGKLMKSESMTLHFVWLYGEVRKHGSKNLDREDVFDKTAAEILIEAGYRPETPELIANLEKETERYYAIKDNVGEQYLARGTGVSDLDDAGASGYRWQSWGSDEVRVGANAATRVVIDVLYESDKARKESDRHATVDPFRWHKQNMRFFAPATEDDIIQYLYADQDHFEVPYHNIPVHPLVPCFDLDKHRRIHIHINNLERYEYDRSVAQHLVLPKRDWNMVNVLVDHSTNVFEDVVRGKGQSMNVLSEGPPGTGKTVTAEVFAEFKERPLYTVQCSQLGIDPTEVEKTLRVILERANRWNAILLLDEADVYIRRRGDDITQNAIVGVFLRILEYTQCILFMTTNLPDDVDDAIASRCIARLRYGVPSVDDQVRIWKALSTVNDLNMPEAEMQAVATRHPNLSGRDVKNLLKLASFIAGTEDITAETIEEALAFKPTSTARLTLAPAAGPQPTLDAKTDTTRELALRRAVRLLEKLHSRMGTAVVDSSELDLIKSAIE